MHPMGLRERRTGLDGSRRGAADPQRLSDLQNRGVVLPELQRQLRRQQGAGEEETETMTYEETVRVVKRIHYAKRVPLARMARRCGVHWHTLRRFLGGANVDARNYVKILCAYSLLAHLAAPVQPLTLHEMEVAKRLSDGLCRKQIAEDLGCSVKAVDVALKTIAAKLGFAEVNVALITRYVTAKLDAATQGARNLSGKGSRENECKK
jgi:DNA-binding CsgD family transcriptional regulator